MLFYSLILFPFLEYDLDQQFIKSKNSKVSYIFTWCLSAAIFSFMSTLYYFMVYL